MTSIVRARCLRFIKLLEENEVKELPLNVAKDLFMEYIGILDDQSISAYFGQRSQIQKTVVNKVHRYATGTNSMSKIEYSRALMVRRGYFEILGLAGIEQRGSNLFFVVNREKGLVNDLKVVFPRPPFLESVNESSSKGLADFSLSSIAFLEGRELNGNRHEVVDRGENRERERESYKEREKSDNAVIINEEEMISTHLSDRPVRLRKQPTEEDIFAVYESLASRSQK